jgi:hypothetical protein
MHGGEFCGNAADGLAGDQVPHAVALAVAGIDECLAAAGDRGW